MCVFATTMGHKGHERDTILDNFITCHNVVIFNHNVSCMYVVCNVCGRCKSYDCAVHSLSLTLSHFENLEFAYITRLYHICRNLQNVESSQYTDHSTYLRRFYMHLHFGCFIMSHGLILILYDIVSEREMA